MTTFNHIDHIGQKYNISILEDNIKSFLDWGFLNIGAFINVQIPTSGMVGGNFHQCKAVPDPGSLTNRVWEAPKKDWVYESGVSFSGSLPTNISGVYLNGTFLPAPNGTQTYGYYLDYPNGRINFNKSVSSTSRVELEYSYRYVEVYKANETTWWKELQTETYNPANFKTNPDLNITSNHRIQTPAIIIETAARTVLTPYELGTTQNIITQDLLLHIFTENAMQRNSLIEILLEQKDKSLNLYNINKVIKNDVNGLNYRGEINPSGLNYHQLSNNLNYIIKRAFIKKAELSELNTISNVLYNGIVRWSVEIFP
jgi:hypothetical protein